VHANEGEKVDDRAEKADGGDKYASLDPSGRPVGFLLDFLVDSRKRNALLVPTIGRDDERLLPELGSPTALWLVVKDRWVAEVMELREGASSKSATRSSSMS